ncbi:hypothetical protein N9Q58_04325 [Polaribacter sp.]|nr:hypothetical protein [Polaribacter sp.]
MSSTEIIEESNYYPFGLKMRGFNNVVSSNGNSVAQKFGYNGVELEESLGLDLMEMDFRQYDPAIARFTSIDPVTHHSMSTYTAFDNNPIFWADPSGADAEWNGDFGESVFDRRARLDSQSNTNEKPDDTYKVSKNGKITKVDSKKYYDKDGNEVDKLITDNSKSTFVDTGVLKHVDEDKNSGTGATYQYFSFSNAGSEKIDKLFRFLVNNTNVEWGTVQFGKLGKHTYFTTTFMNGEEHGGVDILNGLLNDGVFSDFIKTHSHPDGWFQNSPSGYRWFHSNSNDKDVVKTFSKNYPKANIKYRILTKGKGKYVYYNLKGIIK